MNSRSLRFAALVAVVSSLFVSCGKGASSSSDKEKGGGGGKKPSKLAAVVLELGEFNVPLSALATVRASEAVDLRTELAGKLAVVSFQEGAAVRRGQVLARLDDAEARADRDKAAAHARLADATLARIRAQWKAEAASAQQVEVAAADSAVAHADLALAEVALGKTVLASPFDGVVGLRDVSRGQWVPSGQILTHIVSRSVDLEGSVLGTNAGRVRKGQIISWNDPSGRAKGRATVDVMDPWIDPDTRARRLRVHCQTGCESLVPGAAVRLEFPDDRAKVLSVPSTALAGDAKGLALYVYRGGKAVLVPAEIGRRTSDRLEVLSGVAVGDTVLIPGASPPKTGSEVGIARILDGKTK